MKKIILPATFFLSFAAWAQTEQDSSKTKQIEGITITSQKNGYKVDASQTVSKMPFKRP